MPDPLESATMGSVGRSSKRCRAVSIASVLGAVDETPLLETLLPGPSTVIVKPGPTAAELAGGWPFDGLGMRLIDVAPVTEVCQIAGPVTATSANRHGAPGAVTVGAALEGLAGAGRPGIAVDGGLLPGGHSQVVDIRGGRERIIRTGGLRRDSAP